MDIAPFYKGQEVLAIANHSQNAFKKGQEFIIMGIFKSCCGWRVIVGIKKPKGTRNTCPTCYRKSTYITDQWIFNSDLFIAKEAQDFEEVTYQEVLETEKHYISTN